MEILGSKKKAFALLQLALSDEPGKIAANPAIGDLGPIFCSAHVALFGTSVKFISHMHKYRWVRIRIFTSLNARPSDTPFGRAVTDGEHHQILSVTCRLSSCRRFRRSRYRPRPHGIMQWCGHTIALVSDKT